MKAHNVGYNIFKGLIAALMTICFAVNSEAKTKGTITLQVDTSKMSNSKINMSKEPIIVFATYRVKEGQFSTVLNIVSELVKKTRAEKGNLFYKVQQSNSDMNTIIFYEGYKDEAALAAHRNSEHYQMLIIGKILPLLEDRKVVLATELFQN